MDDKTTSPTALNVINFGKATFKCVFPACGGKCCREGEPGLEPAEIERIDANLGKFTPHLRPAAQAFLAQQHFMTDNIKEGRRTMAVVEDWCVFFNEGCVLHKIGAMEGEKYRYKPWLCVTFPLERYDNESWHVRQWGENGEEWDIFCLNPAETTERAQDTLAEEVQFATEVVNGQQAWRGIKPLGEKPPAE